LPVRQFPSTDDFRRRSRTPQGPTPFREAIGNRTRTGNDYAHARLPTSALVEAKTFSPSLTLS
jgi:hypothetical protein